MLALINKKHVLLIVGLFLFFVLLAVPVLAEKRSERADKSSRNDEQKQQNKEQIAVNRPEPAVIAEWIKFKVFVKTF